jgi:general secretion pathway protein A
MQRAAPIFHGEMCLRAEDGAKMTEAAAPDGHFGGATRGSLHRFSGLRENPFNATPDPRFLVLTENVRRKLDELAYAIRSRKGLILLTGEVGTGKTVLIRLLLDHLREEGVSRAFIFNSHLNANELFRLALADFGVAQHANGNLTPAARLQHWLAEPGQVSGNAVLVTDEAQGLSLELLEEIRLLLDVDGARGKALQVILCGQPELDEKLRRPEFRAIRQRIRVRCTTMPLSREETDEYISHRLRVAGAASAIAFPSEAVDLLYLYSRGIPRVLNLLCEHSLMQARAAGSPSVSLEIVEEVARQLQFDDDRRVAPGRARSYAAASGAACQNSDPIPVPSREREAPNLSRLEKKYPVAGLHEVLLSRPAAIPGAAAAESRNRPAARHSTVLRQSLEGFESVHAVGISGPAPFSPEEKRPPETRRVIAATDAPSLSDRSCVIPYVPPQLLQVIVYRMKKGIATFWRSALSFAASSILGKHLATMAVPKLWNQAWENLRCWLQEPMRSDKTHRGVSRKASFTRSTGD